MNIFYLDPNPKVCAEMHCDKHVVKMIIEYAQLLSTAHRVLDGVPTPGYTASGRRRTDYPIPSSRDGILYRATHLNHPSAVWARATSANYDWLYVLWRELMSEYTYRYHKRHACEKLISALKPLPYNIKHGEFTEPPPAMPDYCKIAGNSVASYRNYYIKEKISFAKWKREIPEWFVI